jgi:hypothetical protein
MDMVYRHLVSRQMGPPVIPQRSPEYLAENQAGRLMAVEGPLFALSTLAIMLRFYVRIFMLKTFGWDGMSISDPRTRPLITDGATSQMP